MSKGVYVTCRTSCVMTEAHSIFPSVGVSPRRAAVLSQVQTLVALVNCKFVLPRNSFPIFAGLSLFFSCSPKVVSLSFLK